MNKKLRIGGMFMYEIDIRNIDGRLVCRIDGQTGDVEITIKKCTTLIKRAKNGGITIINMKVPS